MGARGLFLVQEKFPRRLIVLVANARRWTIINTLVPGMIDRSIVGYVGRRTMREVGPCFFHAARGLTAANPESLEARRREFLVGVSHSQRGPRGAHRAMNTGSVRTSSVPRRIAGAGVS